MTKHLLLRKIRLLQRDAIQYYTGQITYST